MTEPIAKAPRSDKAKALKAMSVSDLPDYRLMGVYYIQNTSSDKFYIGSSQDIFSRIGSHFYALSKGEHHNIHLQRSYNKNGINAFVWGVCEEVFDVEALLGIEQEWIDEIGDYNICREAGSTRGVEVSQETRQRASVRNSGSGNPMYGTKRPDIAELMRELKTGITLSDEHKRKMSEALKGSKGAWAYPEIAERLREKLKGVNKGRKLTPEHREKISAAIKGRTPSDETREKLRVASTGRTHTEETKAKLSAARKGKKMNLSDEERQRRAENGRKVAAAITPEQRAYILKKALEAKRGVPLTDEHKAKLSAATKGRKLKGEHREKVIQAVKSRVHTDESRAKLSASLRLSAANRTEEEREKWIKNLSASCLGRPSPMKGVKMSEESRKKMSDFHKGKVISDAQREKLRQAMLAKSPEWYAARAEKIKEGRARNQAAREAKEGK